MNLIKSLFAGTFLLFFVNTTMAQVSADSVQSLRQQKQSIELSKKINDQKLKLAKLENTLDAKTREMENTAKEAQQAADDNASAATRLSADAQNKKLAREAESKADNAKKSAKKARVAADNLTDLKKDIETLRNKITSDEAKLAVNPVAVPVKNE